MRTIHVVIALSWALWMGLAAPASAQSDERSAAEKRSAAEERSTVKKAEDDYARAREMVMEGDYRHAADMMRDFRAAYHENAHVADALYWEAFSLYRLGGTDDLHSAADRLRELFDDYEQAARQGDGLDLAASIEKELAQRGDRRAAERMARLADQLRELDQRDAKDDDDDIRLMALDALMQMDADKALPILKSVLDRRDAGSEKLREKAVFILSQKKTDETAQLLMNVARDDPSDKVREQAIFWLGQVPGDESFDLLTQVIRSEKDEDLQAKAVFALSQHDDERVGAILREIALDRSRGDEVRSQAIFWLGQHGRASDIGFLKDLYASLENSELKGQALFAASQHGGSEARAWLREIALDPKEDGDIRGNAIFWLAQNGGLSVDDMRELYKTLDDPELRGQVLFAASQTHGAGVVDFLVEVAKSEKDPELRKNAVFWLGQVDDDRAAQVLREIIEQ